MKKLFLCFIFPILLSIILHYGFCTNYTQSTFNISGFNKQYNSGVFQYRIVGIKLIPVVYNWLNTDNIVASHFRTVFQKTPIRLHDSDNAVFYGAYMIVNTIGLIIMCFFLYLLVPQLYKYFSILLIVGLSLYVVTPYDTLSYAALVSGYYLIKTNKLFIVLLFLILVGTLIRESMALIIPFYIACNCKDYKKIVMVLITFLISYFGIRYFMGSYQINHTGYILDSTIKHGHTLIGLAMLLMVSFILLMPIQKKRKVVIYTLFALPYLIYTICVAQPWEIRLWVPYWLGISTIEQ